MQTKPKQSLKGKRVLITGGAGFIGRWAVKQALEIGAEATVLDNFLVGPKSNLDGIAGHFRLAEGDMTDREFVARAMKEAKPEIVIHLAAHHFIPFCNANPEETMRVNGEGTMAVLRAAHAAGAHTALVASSGVLYPPTKEPLSEDGPTEVTDVYGLSKKLTEDIATFFETTTEMNCPIARLFNTYGPYETNAHLIPHIMESIHRGNEIPLGNLDPKRDYIYVEDTARFVLALSGLTDKGVLCNVGTGEEYSVREVMERISSILGRELEINVDQSRVRQTDKLHQRADMRKLIALTGEESPIGLNAGLTALLKHEKLIG
jgi:UDP-glucose 4-epimerase